jgi:hypothetical protein
MSDSLGNALGFFFVVIHDQHKALQSRHDTNRAIRRPRRVDCGGKIKLASANFLWPDALIDKGQVILLSLHITCRGLLRHGCSETCFCAQRHWQQDGSNPQHGIEPTNNIHSIYIYSR